MPEKIARYDVVSELGSGAMGIVYQARDHYLGIDVAIKMLISTGLNKTHLMRFQKEAKAISQLKHPGFVNVLDFGLDGANPYMVLEYVKGKNLSEYLKTKTVEDRTKDTIDSLNIARQVAEAMDHAHRKKVLHRDLKPGNILLIEDEGKTTIKIIDFGIAVLMNQELTGRYVTPSEAIIGTPNYMSPEQASNGEIDHRSDIYSLGCILFELLEGKPPFAGDSPLDVLEKHQNAPTPPLTNSTAGQEIKQLVEKALAKKPDDRFQSMNEMADAIALAIRNLSASQRIAIPIQPQQDSYEVTIKLKPVLIVITAIVSIAGILVFVVIQNSKTAEPKIKDSTQLEYSKRTLTEYEDDKYSKRTDELIKQKAAKGFLDKTLRVAGGDVTDEGFEACRNARVHRIWASDLGNVTDRTLNVFSTMRVLRVLDLSSNRNFTAKGFAELKKLKQLHSLKLSNCALTPESIREIGGISNLVSLGLSGNPGIGEGLMKSLSKLNELQILAIGADDLTGKDLKDIGQFKKLWAMNIAGNNKLTDDDVIDIIKRARHLKTLSVSTLKLSDRVLEEASKSPTLLHIDAVGGSSFSKQAIARFESSKPANSSSQRRVFLDAEHWAYIRYAKDPKIDFDLAGKWIKF